MTCYMRGVRSRRSFNKRIDLQPGEYQRLDERQPFFGVAAIPLLKVGVSVWIIGYCLAWPERRPTMVKPLDLSSIGTLTFEAADRDRFPCLPLAEAAMRRGEGAPCVLNAANEVAVEAFLADQIGFLDIAGLVETTLDKIEAEGGLSEPQSLAAATELDSRARKIALACL